MTSSDVVVFWSRAPLPTRLCTGCLTAFLLLLSTSVLAIDVDMAVERELLTRLLSEGHYRQAVTEAERLEKSVKPRRKDGEYIGKAMATVEIQIYRGIMYTRMGDLSAAEEALQSAYRQLNERDFQTRLAISQRSGSGESQGVAAYAHVLALELTDAASQLLVDRIRRANEYYRASAKASSSGTAQPAQAQVDAVEEWVSRLDKLTSETLSSRGQIDQALSGLTADLSSSSRLKALKSESRPRMYAALRALEVSKLPWTVADAVPTRGGEEVIAQQEQLSEIAATRQAASTRQLQRASVLITQATADLESAIGPAPLPPATNEQQIEASEDLPSGAGIPLGAVGAEATSDDSAASATTAADKTEQETAILHADLLEASAEVEFQAHDMKAARKHIDAALYLRKRARGSEHPELVRGSILSAEISLLEAEEARRIRDPHLARQKAEHAVAAIEFAKRLLESPTSEFDPNSPLHDVLRQLLTNSTESRTTSSDAVAASDAADAAAIRALAAIRSQEAATKQPKPSEDQPTVDEE